VWGGQKKRSPTAGERRSDAPFQSLGWGKELKERRRYDLVNVAPEGEGTGIEIFLSRKKLDDPSEVRLKGTEEKGTASLPFFGR